MPNEEAARQTDPIGHGLGLLGLIGGAILGAALVVGTGLTGGALAVAVIGTAAAAGLAGESIVNGVSKVFDWKPQTGVIGTGSPNVKIGNQWAARAVLDTSLSCHGLYGLHHFPLLPPVPIAEGAELVAINGMPAARVNNKLVCGAVINHGQANVLIGGPTVRLLSVISFEEFLHDMFELVGLGYYYASWPLSKLMGDYIFGPIYNQLGKWGDELGPGWRDIFQGSFTLAMITGGSLLARRSGGKVPAQRSKKDILAANKKRGAAREREVGQELRREGHEVLGSQVTVKTSQTNRVIDHLIRDRNTGEIRAIEVKSGNADRTPTQIRKDNAMANEGATVIGKNAPDWLQGQKLKIPTEVRH